MLTAKVVTLSEANKLSHALDSLSYTSSKSLWHCTESHPTHTIALAAHMDCIHAAINLQKLHKYLRLIKSYS